MLPVSDVASIIELAVAILFPPLLVVALAGQVVMVIWVLVWYYV
jgi:hypothetical protein